MADFDNPMSFHTGKAALEMPRYRCHKIVQALEIASWSEIEGGYQLDFGDDWTEVNVMESMFARYKPVSGDFYVLYEDDYASISPRQAFLDGYTRINETAWAGDTEHSHALNRAFIEWDEREDTEGRSTFGVFTDGWKAYEAASGKATAPASHPDETKTLHDMFMRGVGICQQSRPPEEFCDLMAEEVDPAANDEALHALRASNAQARANEIGRSATWVDRSGGLHRVEPEPVFVAGLDHAETEIANYRARRAERAVNHANDVWQKWRVTPDACEKREAAVTRRGARPVDDAMWTAFEAGYDEGCAAEPVPAPEGKPEIAEADYRKHMREAEPHDQRAPQHNLNRSDAPGWLEAFIDADRIVYWVPRDGE